MSRNLRLPQLMCFLLCICGPMSMAQLSDDFERLQGFEKWTIFQSGDPDYYQSLMCNDSLIEGQTLANTAGRLVITCANTFWFSSTTGPYVYQLTWGDFTATTSVQALNRTNTSVPPSAQFNSAGLIVRNPSTALGQNYIMTNLGMQSSANGVGSESKTTFNSNSTLFLDPDLNYGEVRIERTGTEIRTYKRTGSDSAFVLLDIFDRPDIPDTVQIGMVLNGWTSAPDIRGEFNWIRFEGGDCRIVRNTADSGPNSLRSAINCAEDGDTILFDNTVWGDTIDLDSVIITDKQLSLLGDFEHPIVIQSAGNPVFQILNDGNMAIQDLGIEGTAEPGEYLIENSGTLLLRDVNFGSNGTPGSTIRNQGQLTIEGETSLGQ